MKLRNVPKGILVRTINSHKRIYTDYPLAEAAKQSGNVSYLKGTSYLGNKLFVKRVPVEVKVDCSKIIKAYRDFAHIANVVSLRSFEQNDQFTYMAFEETTVHALMQLQKNHIIHGAVAPQHLLMRRGPRNDGMIKLCGMRKSERMFKSETVIPPVSDLGILSLFPIPQSFIIPSLLGPRNVEEQNLHYLYDFSAAALAYICKGDALMVMEQYDAIGDFYSMALHLDPSIRRSKSFKNDCKKNAAVPVQE
ncbi:glutamine--tRNA ligase [Tanacetum coccineum]